MSYKTILVHADRAAAADQRIRLAARLASSFGAHLVGAAPTGVSRFIPPASLAVAGRAFNERCAVLRRAAAMALAHFEMLATGEGVDSIEPLLVEDEADAGLALLARYCDLVVVGQSNPTAPDPPTPDDLPEYLLLTGARPVLVVPYGHDDRGVDGGAVVAWDGSVEAARAVAAALPLLHMARRATVIGFGDEPARRGDPGVQDCDELVAWLRRHGIEAHASPRALLLADAAIGDALLSAAADLGAGLLVMGGYGHARFRELLLGGVTATVLRSMTLPVLLAH